MKSFVFVIIGLVVAMNGYSFQNNSHISHYKARNATKNIEELHTGGIASSYLSIRYFDGLGRPIQELGRQASPSGADLVQPYFYDFAGRESREYLPYPRGGGALPGGFRPNALSEQRSFYRNNFGGEERAFTQHTFESSALRRVVTSLGPGQAWASETGRATTFAERPNLSADGVRRWEVDAQGLPHSPGAYEAGRLWMRESKDEQGNRRMEFIDLEGQIILIKVQEGESPSLQHAGWLCTYHVYDARGDLRVLIPPKATRFLTGAWHRSRENAIVEGQYFLYTYDHLGRLQTGKLPGKAVKHYVYDNRDRVVATQDGKLRDAGTWHYTKYDVLNRKLQEGLVKDARNRNSMQSFHESLNGENNARLESQLSPAGTTYKVGGGFPTNEGKVLMVNFYDGPTAPGMNTFVRPSGFTDPDHRTKGLLTAVLEVEIGGQERLLRKSFFYDKEARLIQELVELSNGGTLRRSTSYNFEGKTLRKLEQLRGPAKATLRHRYSYSRSGHLSMTRVKMESDPEQVLVRYSYDRLGRLSGKTLPLLGVEVNQGYHLRGWPLWMEQRQAGKGLFSWRLHYEKGGNQGRWDGNISMAAWKGKDGVERQYHFRYDPVSRLIGGAYLVPGRSHENHHYTSGWNSYDPNGNLLTLKRRNQISESSFGEVDDLRYEYGSHGNRLLKVRDARTSTQFLAMDFKPSPSEAQYTYDSDGNLLTNPDRGINRMVYNHLDLPAEILHPGGRVENVYSASGERLSQRRYLGEGMQEHWEWAGSFVLKNGKLHQALHDEGRVIPALDGFYYDFYARDHLGSLRQVMRAPKLEYQTATMEADRSAHEEAQFEMIQASRQGAKEHNTTPGGDRVVWLNATMGRVLGPVRVQKVKEGEQVHLSVNGKYRAGGAGMFGAQVFAVSGARSGVVAALPDFTHVLHDPSRSTALLGIVTLLAGALQTKPAPEAYMMYLLYDAEGKRYKTGKLALDKNAEGKHMHLEENLYIDMDGRMEAFLVNESGVDVWFDDFRVGTSPPLVVEETHYDPWGLELSGLEYRYQGERYGMEGFNGKDLVNPPGLYDFGARHYDPVVGRWWGVDPMGDHPKQIGMSPYSAFWNNPVRYIDPDGKMPCCPGGARPAARNSRRGMTISKLRRPVSQTTRINNSGFALVGRNNGTHVKTQRFHTSRGGGRNIYTSIAAGAAENFDNTHTNGNSSGNFVKLTAQLLDDVRTITKVEIIEEVGRFEVSLGANYFVNDFNTTIELMELQEQWESNVRERARGGLSPEEFGELQIEEQNMRMGLSRVFTGPSPLSMIEDMLNGVKPDTVDKRRNDVVRPSN
ncbi:DUF6443 domain-containing protein [Pleomorphovibrio marinus]|uniref:DUF6443 domain-containing protein n=1 Tax=Pleomorphovibrio marinus TaxID=2164132 RepID=UPI0018E55F64|nr:DUF6443 domain-containing protein [Pleomorphovibrio marinus]